VYVNNYPTCLDKLIKLNDSLLRIVRNQERVCHVRDLYINYNTLSISELHDRQLLTLVLKTLYYSNLLPNVLDNYFNLNSTVHEHLTRSKSDIHIHRAHTVYLWLEVSQKQR